MQSREVINIIVAGHYCWDICPKKQISNYTFLSINNFLLYAIMIFARLNYLSCIVYLSEKDSMTLYVYKETNMIKC